MSRRRVFFWLVSAMALTICGCARSGSESVQRDGFSNLRIYESPYAGVDWSTDLALKAQHHDHVGTRGERILAYDRAGYDVLSLLDYSGSPTATFAWKERIWPPETYVPAAVLGQLRNIDVLFPGAEEVGLADHVTSPFLTSYLEVVLEGSLSQASWQYRTLADLLSKVRDYGGIPCLAHPWYTDLTSYASSVRCVEIYSAYAEAMRSAGRTDFTGTDRNALLLRRWDAMLDLNERIVGISVNDHTGPYLKDGAVPDAVRDSGKIIVMAKQATLASYREAFERGAVISVRDNGLIKDAYPRIRSIRVDEEGVFIDVAAEVAWFSRAGLIATGPLLALGVLPVNTRWVRAEVRGEGSTELYTQAFVVRPVGDVDGDYDVDDVDSALCRGSDVSANAAQASACAAIAVP